MTQRETEHELSAALSKVDEQRELLRLCREENEGKRKDIIYLATEKAKLELRIDRLEEAGDEMHDGWRGNRNNMDRYLVLWRKAKEAKP